MENNELNNNNVNLIKRTYTKFKSSKIVKRLALLTIAAATVITLAACDENTQEPDEPSYNIGGVQNNNNNNNSNENRNPIDVSGYSQILQNILLNEHYDNLLASITNENNILERGEFKPHPYAFLQSEGFDVDAIKNDEIDAYTMSFVLDEEPNNLYMYTRVMQDNSYWTNYLLKYELTEQEMDDYHELHAGHQTYNYYIQSVFMNNEISKTRKPEIIGKSNIDIEAFDDITESSQGLKNLFDDINRLKIIFLNPNKDNRTFEMFIVPEFNNEFKMCFSSKVIECDGRCSDMNIYNSIYLGPSNYSSSMMLNNRKDYTATYYFSQDVELNLASLRNFETIKKP